jgi:hypothetical protein
MKNLIKELKRDNETRTKHVIKLFNDELKESQELTRVEKHTLNRKTPYKKSRISQVENRIKEIHNKRLQIELDKVESVNNALDTLPNDLVLTINFYKSSMWGYCPKGNDNYGHKTDSISGCGYCKESTATGQLLSQNEIILKKMYKAMNKPSNLKKGSRESLGYGSGYGILPSFSGGVGTSCHISILEKLGYKVTQSGNDTTTVLVISEK